MLKFSLIAAPTFVAKVPVPVAGGAAVEVEMTFRHRTKSELETFIAGRAEATDAESFMDMVTGWELSDEYNQASVDLLLENYIGTAVATYLVYVNELLDNKVKN